MSPGKHHLPARSLSDFVPDPRFALVLRTCAAACPYDQLSAAVFFQQVLLPSPKSPCPGIAPVFPVQLVVPADDEPRSSLSKRTCSEQPQIRANGATLAPTGAARARKRRAARSCEHG